MPRSRSTVCWVGPVESIALRARCSALLTEAADVPSCYGRLGRGEAEHLAQDQRRPLQRGQVLQRRDEGELDALAGVRYCASGELSG